MTSSAAVVAIQLARLIACAVVVRPRPRTAPILTTLTPALSLAMASWATETRLNKIRQSEGLAVDSGAVIPSHEEASLKAANA